MRLNETNVCVCVCVCVCNFVGVFYPANIGDNLPTYVPPSLD